MAENETRTRRKKIDDKDLKRVMDRVAQNICRLRRAKNLSQQVLATSAGIATTTLSDIERGQAHNLKLSTLVSLARQLDLKDITELLT
ncbi:MAG: helix-turn-helix transcriptional regulator [Bdellovibrionaceae bacterium]|nr:helix-turn-helix transcriptional regulator [Pseudobdellovibrionaceae bacterium]